MNVVEALLRRYREQVTEVLDGKPAFTSAFHVTDHVFDRNTLPSYLCPQMS